MRLSRRGFTLVELIVVMGVLGVLLSLTIPLLGRVRRRGDELICQTNMRSATLVVLEYTTRFGDTFPFAGSEAREALLPAGFGATIGGEVGLTGNLWTALFPVHWSAMGFDPAMKCPAQPPYEPGNGWNPGSAISVEGVFPNTLYGMSDALWLDPSSLRPGTTGDQIRSKANSVASVRFPSRKAVHFELVGFCIPRAAVEWVDLMQTPLHPTSVSCVDGSVRRFVRNDALPTATGGLGFTTTVDGIRGRDLPE